MNDERQERWENQQLFSDLETQLKEANDRIMDLEPMEARLEVLEVTIEAMIRGVDRMKAASGDPTTDSLHMFVHGAFDSIRKKEAAPESTDATPNEGVGDEPHDDEQF